MEEALKDERFSHILSDPRFRKMPKNVRKITVQKRFKSVFKDKSLNKCLPDKRGRALNLAPSENLKKLYNITSESSEDDDTEEDINENHQNADQKIELQKNNTFPKKSDSSVNKVNEKVNDSGKIKERDKKTSLSSQHTGESSSEESDDSDDYERHDDVEDQINDTVKIKENKKKASLDEDSDESTSEESDDSDSESEDGTGNKNEDFDHQWEELRNNAPNTDEITRRIAVCNMDWDRIRAVDLIVCFNSFKPPDGSINSVKIYPSEYGLQRMEEEKLNGPPELVKEPLPLDEDELEGRKGSKYHREKLRQYQISRLKYYYAVVDCDSPETANILYEQLNGMEYESSSVRFDLRFIPDDVTFDQEPTSVAEKAPDPTDYKPRLFVTSALQQVKVDLTWDETDPKRREFFQKVFTDPDSIQSDIHDYLASASSESEEEENTADDEPDKKLKTKERIVKYKQLLLSLEEKEKEEENKFDVEVIWKPALKEETEERVKEKIKKDTLNPFEEMLQKKKVERKLKKKEQKTMQEQEAESSLSDDSEKDSTKDALTSNGKAKDDKRLAELALITDSKKETDSDEILRKKSKKAKSRELDGFVGDPNDPRFSAMYTSSLFNIAPSDRQSKKNEGKYGVKPEKRKFKSAKFHESHKKTKRTKY